MSLAQLSDDTSPSKEEIYQTLLRSLSRRKGFGIVFVQSSPLEAQRLIRRVLQDLPQKKIATLQLTEPINNLYELIEDRSDRNELNIIFIQGLEKSLEPFIKPGFGGEGDYYNIDTVPSILSHLNQRRELFRDRFNNICFVFVLPAFAIKYFIRRAPDFFDWSTGVFNFPLDLETSSQELSDFFEKRDRNNYSGYSLLESQKLLFDIQQIIDECDDNTNLADLYFKQGLVLQGIKRYKEAVDSYQKALQIHPEDPDIYSNLGIALFNIGRFEQAIFNYNKCLTIRPDYYVWNNRGDVLRALGRFSEAIESYSQALRLKPNDRIAWASLFETLFDGNSPEYRMLLANIQRSLHRYHLDSYYDPSDIISEVYIRLMGAVESMKIRSLENPLIWIRVMASNIINQSSRNQDRRNLTQSNLVYLDPIDLDLLEDYRTFENSSVEDDLEVLKKALNHLSPEDREIITLRTIEELSWSEISKRLALEDRKSINMQVVLSRRYTRALERLKQVYRSFEQ